MIAPIKSLADLRSHAAKDERYTHLAIAAANNLGGNVKTLDAAFRELNLNAIETDEAGVIDEVNFCRDLI